jgi:hypothetical protein
MKTILAGLALLTVPATAFAVFSTSDVPEPGALELVGLGGAVLVVVRLLKRKK